MKIAVVNLRQIVSGDWRNPFVAGDTIVTDGDKLAAVGSAATKDVASADVVIDAGGMTAIPGLIDSHVHVTFGDYTAAAHRRLSGKLPAWRHHHRHLSRCRCQAARAIPRASRRWRLPRSAASPATGWTA